jgi:ATP-dependent Lon protease
MHILTSKKESEPEEKQKTEQENIPSIPSDLPILPLRGTVVYPLTVLPLNIAQEREIRLVDDAATSPTRLIGLATAKDAKLEGIGPDDIFPVGTVAIIHRMLRAPDNTVRLIVQGVDRIRIKEFVTTEPYLRAGVVLAPEFN